MDKTLYTPGTDVVDLNAPGGVKALLALHRGIFGGYSMEGEDTPPEGGEPPVVNEFGFPDKTPVKDMTAAHQAAYWRHQSRKHEDRVKDMSDYDQIKTERDALKAQHQTADEKALEDAKSAAAAAARAEERGKVAPLLVAAEFKSANAGRLEAGALAAVLDGIEPTKFLTSEGEVDADKVKTYVDAIAPADSKKKWPDMGQGRREQSQSKGVDAGRALYESSRSKKS